jgi:hypothetical protein
LDALDPSDLDKSLLLSVVLDSLVFVVAADTAAVVVVVVD